MRALVLLFTFFLFLGGCLSNDSANGSGGDGNAPPSLPPPPSPPSTVKPTTIGGGDDLVWLNDTHGASRLRIFENATQFADQQAFDCPYFDAQPVWFLTVWNRTGTVAFHSGTDGRDTPFNVSIPLPPGQARDVPLLFFFQRFCGFAVTFELQADLPVGKAENVWGRAVSRGRVMDPPVMKKDVIEIYEIRFPPGQMDTELIVPADPLRVHVDQAGLLGLIDWQEGARYGEVWMHDPLSTGDDDWATHVVLDPLDSDWEQRRMEAAVPGAYRFPASLTAPWPTETVWTSEMWLYKLQPDELAKLGFDVPLRYWL